jgi:acyl carrier protein
MDTFTKVAELLSAHLGVDVGIITLESDIIKDLGADSLDVVQLLMDMEDNFGIVVSEDDAANLKTVGDIVNLISK